MLSIVLVWIIYKQVLKHDELYLEWSDYIAGIGWRELLLALVAFILMPLNIGLESMKWNILVNEFDKHSPKKAVFGVLTGMAAGLITPARLGEYVGRLMYINPENNWKGVWSNFVSSISQNLVNVAIGLSGLLILLTVQTELPRWFNNLLLVISIGLGAFLIILYYNLQWLPQIAKYLPDHRILIKIKSSLKVFMHFENRILNRVLILSLFRYFVFVGQYYLMIRFWGIHESWLILAAIGLIYLIQSVVPLPPLIGLLARGEIALIVLGYFSSNGLMILSAAFSIWIINLAIPSLIGLLLFLNVDISKSLGYNA